MRSASVLPSPSPAPAPSPMPCVVLALETAPKEGGFEGRTRREWRGDAVARGRGSPCLGLDPFEEVARIDAGKSASQGHLSTGFDRVWVLQGDGSTLAGIDPQTQVVGAPIALPVRGTDLAAGSDGIWIVSALDDAVVVINLPREIPDPRLSAALDGIHRLPGVRARKRARGLHLHATDIDWSTGHGAEVHGPGEALLMALAGRPVALAGLSGEGVRILAQRVSGQE